MTFKELKQETRSIIDDAFEKAKQDPLFDDEESRCILDFTRSNMLFRELDMVMMILTHGIYFHFS